MHKRPRVHFSAGKATRSRSRGERIAFFAERFFSRPLAVYLLTCPPVLAHPAANNAQKAHSKRKNALNGIAGDHQRTSASKSLASRFNLTGAKNAAESTRMGATESSFRESHVISNDERWNQNRNRCCQCFRRTQKPMLALFISRARLGRNSHAKRPDYNS